MDYILQFDGAEINITAQVGDGPVSHTVTSLTAGTEYTFTLFTVFNNVRSSGVNTTAVTGKMCGGFMLQYLHCTAQHSPVSQKTISNIKIATFVQSPKTFPFHNFGSKI